MRSDFITSMLLSLKLPLGTPGCTNPAPNFTSCPFIKGDRIRMGDTYGDAVEKTLIQKKPQKYRIIYSALYKNIQDTFHYAGLEMITFHYQAYRDSSPPFIPPVF